jgi:hypothetical protein
MNFLEIFSSQLGANQMDTLSDAVGGDRGQTNAAIGAMVPLIVSALARNTKTPEGANALANALDRDHDGGVLTMIPNLVSRPDLFKGDGILGHVLGNRRPVAQSAVSQASGLSPENTGKLFAMVAPIVMGMIGAKKRQEGFGADILSSLLNGFARNHENDQPQSNDNDGGGLLGTLGGLVAGAAGGGDGGGGLLGTIGGMVAGAAGGQQNQRSSGGGMGSFISAILDRDNDGSVVDDIGGMIGGFLTNRK